MNEIKLSKTVLNIIESWRTEENSQYIDKYKETLLNESNNDALKFNIHHIIPCFIFKDDTHKTRKETEELANKIEGNKIKLSVSNHIKAHYYLKLIFKDNKDALMSVYFTCGQIDVKQLTEKEINEIAKLIEDCTKENITKEEFKKYQKKWNEENKEHMKKYHKEYYETNKEKISNKTKERYYNNIEHEHERSKNYYNKNKEECTKYNRKYYDENRDEILKKKNIYRENNKEKIVETQKKHYKTHKQEMLKRSKKYYENHKTERKLSNDKYEHQSCYDPIENDFCTFATLKHRKQRHKEKYKDVTPSKCIIK